MKVVWAYSEKLDTVGVNLQKELTSQASLILSTVSWMKYAPRVKRVLYTDKNVCNFLLKKGLTDLWDEIISVDFVRDIVLRWGMSSSTCLPYYTCSLQDGTEPFWYSDYKTILVKDPSKRFNTKVCHLNTGYPLEEVVSEKDVDGALLQYQDFYKNREFGEEEDTEIIVRPNIMYFPSGKSGKAFGIWALGSIKIEKACKVTDFFTDLNLRFGTCGEWFYEVDVENRQSVYRTIIGLEQKIGVDIIHSYPELFGKKKIL